jgi:DNA-binding CsgD family transcriptional regulator
MDVLALLVQGNSTKQICRELCLAEGTIKVHTTAILRALDAASRTQAICALTRLGVSLSALAALRSARLARASVGRVGDGSAGTVRLMTGALGAG